MGEMFKGLSTPVTVIIIAAAIVVADHIGIFDSPINGLVGDYKVAKTKKTTEKK